MFCNLGEGQTIKEIACKKAQTIYREEENWKKKKLQSSRWPLNPAWPLMVIQIELWVKKDDIQFLSTLKSYLSGFAISQQMQF